MQNRWRLAHLERWTSRHPLRPAIRVCLPDNARGDGPEPGPHAFPNGATVVIYVPRLWCKE